MEGHNDSIKNHCEPLLLCSSPKITTIDLNINANACKNNKTDPKGIIPFNINLACNPPGSGDISLTKNELITKCLDDHIIRTVNGIKNRSDPKKLIHAFAFNGSLEYIISTLTCLSCFNVYEAPTRKITANRCHSISCTATSLLFSRYLEKTS